MRALVSSFVVFSMIVTLAPSAGAKEYKASLANMPVYAESADKGVLVEFVKALAAESGQTISIEVLPFARSMDSVISRKVDFHLPLIKVPDGDESKLTYSHSRETIFHVNFVLYTNKAKPLDPSKLGQYKLETDKAHTQYFPFPVEGSASVEASLKRVDTGRIDGFIFADFASDPVVRATKLKNVHRQLYKVFDVKIVLPKGEAGGPTDEFLTKTIAAMRKKGTFARIMSAIDTKYDDWQP